MPALALFVFGLVLRLLFVLATPDGGAGWHVGFQGDAPVWQQIALAEHITDLRRSLDANAPTPPASRASLAAELASSEQLAESLRLRTDAESLRTLQRVPLRPPAMQWLVSLLWNGDPARVTSVRLVFLVLGAAVAPLLWWLLRAHIAPRIAFATAALCAASSNLLLLGGGLHVETLYLALVLVALLLQPSLARPGRAGLAAALGAGALHGLLCLVRAEHLLTAALLLALARLSGAAWRTLALAALASAAAIAPWQLHANALVDAYNAGAPPLPRSAIPWDDDAVAVVRALPSFQQLPTFGFVSDTVRARGGARVRAVDLQVVREAYGCFPEPLPHAFVALYGGLNLWLGNTNEADGGFSSAALDRPPPLAGGDAKYPPGLRNVLPHGGTIAFGYPPHLDAIVHGTSRARAEIANDPLAAAGRIAKKLWHAAEGATGGVGGYALPIGLSGVRRQVDCVTAAGIWANVWRALVLAVAAAGLWSLRSVRATWPLIAFALTRLLVVAAVFGYARHGALCVPVVALGIAAAVDRFVPPRRWLAPAVLGAVLLLEVLRCTLGAAATVDGRALTAPLPLQDFQTRQIDFR